MLLSNFRMLDAIFVRFLSYVTWKITVAYGQSIIMGTWCLLAILTGANEVYSAKNQKQICYSNMVQGNFWSETFVLTVSHKALRQLHLMAFCDRICSQHRSFWSRFSHRRAQTTPQSDRCTSEHIARAYDSVACDKRHVYTVSVNCSGPHKAVRVFSALFDVYYLYSQDYSRVHVWCATLNYYALLRAH